MCDPHSGDRRDEADNRCNWISQSWKPQLHASSPIECLYAVPVTLKECKHTYVWIYTVHCCRSAFISLYMACVCACSYKIYIIDRYIDIYLFTHTSKVVCVNKLVCDYVICSCECTCVYWYSCFHDWVSATHASFKTKVFFFFKKHRESSDPLLCKNKDFVTNQPPLDRTLGSGYLQSLMSLAHSFFPSDSAQI